MSERTFLLYPINILQEQQDHGAWCSWLHRDPVSPPLRSHRIYLVLWPSNANFSTREVWKAPFLWLLAPVGNPIGFEIQPTANANTHTQCKAQCKVAQVKSLRMCSLVSEKPGFDSTISSYHPGPVSYL